ncbi:SusC/RagA family TonB-linked outer membrane protein [Mucilaginibacter terrenus]|nr:SusC/RagA family TonB-linked outer membrane protein [Mucilaginibacter terrenus]
MKLTFILIVAFTLQSVANVYSQQKVTLNVRSADFTKVINAIQKQTNYHFVFSERKIAGTKKVSMKVENEDVNVVLDQLLDGTDLKFTQLENNLIVITTKGEVVNAAVLTGKVVDENGLGLPGVTVKIKGTSNGTVTDASGVFSINAPDNAVLVFSFLGYESQEVAVAGKTNITVKLALASKGLNEVVVTALGITKDQKKLGYSVSTVNGDQLNKAKETNVALSLQGRVAGLSVGASNGGPGSSARVLLRGLTSFSAGSPLYVINGVPMDNTQRGAAGEWGGADYGDGISNINPDDIESMTVLKGQSASALYGSRAVNGVILITTKSGKKNSPFGVEFNTNVQFDKPVDNTDYQQVYGQGIQGVKPTTLDAARNSGSLAWGSKMDGSDVMQIDGQMHKYSPVNNYIDFYRTAPSFTNTASFTGGNETGSFRLSASDLRANSMVPNSYLDRKTFNFNGGQQVTKKLNINVVANYVIENSKNRSGLSDGPGNPNNVQFLAPNQDQATLAPGTTATGKELTFTDDSYVTNPYFAAYNFVSNVNRTRLISALSAKYDFTNWLYLQGRVGYDDTNDKRVNIEPTGTGYRNDNGTMNTTNTHINEFNADVLVNAKRPIVKDLLNLDLSVGGNIRKSLLEGNFINGQNGFIIPYFYSLTNFSSRDSGPLVDPASKKQVNSAYYSADFSIKDYLVISTTGRYDYYSSISKAIGPGIFSPSVSGSFIFSELHHMNGVDLGKVRLSFAQTSNDALAFANTVYYSLNNSINGTPAASFSSQLPNLFLKPFTLKEIEAGLEMKFWGDRFGFDVTYFSRKTNNEIINGNLDWSAGYTNRYIGTGSTQNRGVEVELHGTPVRKSGFSWTPSFNFTYVKNKILQTDGITNNNIGFGTFRPGASSGIAVTSLVVGLAGPQILATDYKRDAAGNIVFDASGLPQRGDLKAQGSTIPKIYGGFNNTFNYKQFNLGFLVDYRFGNKVLSATENYSIFRGLNKLTLDGREGGVVGVGVTESGTPNTTSASAQSYYQALSRNVGAVSVLDGSFIKLRQITLGYTFNSTFLRGTPFSSIGVSAVGRNLWTIMKHTDNIDPESGFSADPRYAGIEGTSLPFARTYGLNVNFKFKN